MKNWLTIGQFSKAMGVSAKALRLYESIGLIKSHARGENGYRYYEESQLEIAHRIKGFKDLGFTLAEIKALLEADESLDSDKLATSMQVRLKEISEQAELLKSQKEQIERILSSLQKKQEPLHAEQRRAIMSYYGKVSILITGCDGLEKTAHFVHEHFKSAGQDVPIFTWSAGMELPDAKPYILILPEKFLTHEDVLKINADVIVIKSVSVHSEEMEKAYLRLFAEVGPHVTTVINADDRASVSFAGQEAVRKGRIFYFTKNRALEPQIQHIGGVISDGEELEIYGFNLKSKVEMKYKKILAFEEEIALLSSFAAVMSVGLEKENLAGTLALIK
ncbi:MerR family transcriptional regulator [Bdellovibrio sp. NC01]|uniref:MerR family transcriptional regulator n=1 Tax=Bdellovibrio sp. NC01 TaxID=2220073 RepID=UPI001159284D|nr:MerR family transcriptional regulator [Bdellovibrio sp. NC01]QDK36105.1 transcriptional regulator [Bdellovibrio sp. NC01]